MLSKGTGHDVNGGMVVKFSRASNCLNDVVRCEIQGRLRLGEGGDSGWAEVG